MKRSSIPLVTGILMIIFAAISLVGTALLLKGAGSESSIGASPTTAKYVIMLGILDLLVGAVQLGAGIASVRYRPDAPRRATTYAILRICFNVFMILAAMMLMAPDLREEGRVAAVRTALVSAALLSVWPAIVLWLMSRPAAKAACSQLGKLTREETPAR